MENGNANTLSKVKLIISAALVLTYIAVLYLALNPDVTNEYRAYYIDEISKRWPGQSGYDCVIGEPIVFNEDSGDLKKIDRGRSDATEEGVFIEPDLTVIYLDSVPEGDYVVTLTFGPSDIDDMIDISVTGCSFSEQFVPDHQSDNIVQIPISLHRDEGSEDNLVTIRITSGYHEDILLKEVVLDEA